MIFGASTLKIIFGIVIVVTLGLSGARIYQVVTTKAGPLANQPLLPSAPAPQDRIDKVLDFFKNNPGACPKVTIDPKLEEKFPDFRAALAALKYVLQQDDFKLEPSAALFKAQPPKYPLDLDNETRRRLYRVRLLLDDPQLKFTYNPPEENDEVMAKIFTADKEGKMSTGAAQTKSANEILLTPYAGGTSPGGQGDPKLGYPWKNSFRLAHTILHELVHIDQVRFEGKSAGHGNTEVETPAYAWEASIPPELTSLFHPASLAKLAKVCEGTTSTPNAPTSPPSSQRSGVPTGNDCQTKLAAAVKAVAPSMPFFGESKQSKAEITTPLRFGYDGTPDGAASASVGTPRVVTFSGSWEVKVACTTRRTAKQIAQAYQSAGEPCGKTERRRIVAPDAYGPNSCAWSSVEPGANDPNFSGDPYIGSAGAFIATACGDVTAYSGVGVFAPASHGARNKPDALAAMRTDAEKYAKEITTKVLAAVNQSCGGTPS